MGYWGNYLGGPRTSWSRGTNNVIINNNVFGGGMMPPPPPRMSCFGFGFQTPMYPMNQGCCGGNSTLKTMFGFNLLTNMISNMFGSLNGIFGGSKGSTKAPSAKSSDSTSATLKELEKTVAETNKQLAEARKILESKSEKAGTDKKSEAAGGAAPAAKPEKTEEADKVDKKEKTDESTKPATLDEALNKIDAYKNLTNEQKQYVKDKVKANGDGTYNIEAIVHDQDTLKKIIARFYTKEEQEHLDITSHGYNAQSSGRRIENPASGATFKANNVSEFGLNALIQDAKDNITSAGEQQKTGVTMAKLKEAFTSGKKELSWQYVRHNFPDMKRADYNTYINKYYKK